MVMMGSQTFFLFFLKKLVKYLLVSENLCFEHLENNLRFEVTELWKLPNLITTVWRQPLST